MNTTPMKLISKLAIFSSVFIFSIAISSELSQRELNNGNLVLENIPEIPARIVNDLNQYQNVRSAPFREWNKNGDSIYVSTRFGDVSQLHKVSEAGGTRQQLTFFEEPIGSVVRQPEGELISFTMDAGGNENAQLFLLDPSTGKSQMVSDGESRNGSASWNRDGTAFIYRSNRRNGASNDLWMSSIDEPEKATMVFESPDGSWWGADDWNADGTKVLIQQYVSVTDSRIHLLDIESGKVERLLGSESIPSVNYIVSYDANEEGFYFTTDQAGDFEQLAYYSFKDASSEIVTTDINWNIENVGVSHDRSRMAFSVNQGGVSRVYLYDPKSARYKAVSGLPVGVVGGLEFSPDNKRLALTLNTAKSPSDTYILKLSANRLRHRGLERWTYSEVGGLDSASFVEPSLIEYPSFDKVDEQQRMIPAFVYKPENISEPAPVIISIHGGPESQYRPRFSSTYQLWIKQLGAAVIAPNVRGSSGYGTSYLKLDNGFKREDSVKDIGALLDWIATQPDLDENRVIVFGGSYGGYMVLASAVHYSDRLLGAVDIVGISNFVTFLKNTKDYRRDLRRVEYGDERDPKMYEHLQKISPNNSVEKIKIPMFVVQGNNDPRVPVSEAEQIVEALTKQGNQVWYMNALNEGHGYRKKENRDVYQQVVVMFMESLLVDNDDK